MRLALLALGGCAIAEVPPPAPTTLPSARVIYLDDCLPDGCTVSPGDDDSRTAHSSIVDRPSHLPGFAWGPERWHELVACVQSAYSPFDIVITSVDPGEAPHFEVIVGGSPMDIGLRNGGGAAPLVCPNQLHDNAISFVFAAQGPDLDLLCWAAVQETGHLLGLDHELDRYDAMTWLSPPTHKAGFQDDDAQCGEFDAPRWCSCDRPSQNSYRFLMATLGASMAPPL